MSLIEKIKKIFEEKKNQIEEQQVIEIQFENLPQKIKEKEIEIKIKEDEIKKQFQNEISTFNSEIKRIVPLLERLDLSKRKEHEKIKKIVLQNLDLYITQLKRFSESLKNVDDSTLENYINSILKKINEFNKLSYAPFEKATFLIGESLSDAKRATKTFNQRVSSILEKSKKTIEEINSLNKINGLFSEIEKSSNLDNESEKIKESLLQNIKELNEKIQKFENNITKIKESPEFSLDLRNKEEHSKELQELDKEIQSLKQIIDFKALAKEFHSNEKKSRIIKEYYQNFKATLLNDEELEFAEITKIKSLKQLKIKIKKLEKSLELKSEKDITGLQEEIEATKQKIKEYNSDIEKENKIKEKNMIKKKNTILEIKDLSKKIQINVK